VIKQLHNVTTRKVAIQLESVGMKSIETRNLSEPISLGVHTQIAEFPVHMVIRYQSIYHYNNMTN